MTLEEASRVSGTEAVTVEMQRKMAARTNLFAAAGSVPFEVAVASVLHEKLQLRAPWLVSPFWMHLLHPACNCVAPQCRWQCRQLVIYSTDL